MPQPRHPPGSPRSQSKPPPANHSHSTNPLPFPFPLPTYACPSLCPHYALPRPRTLPQYRPARPPLFRNMPSSLASPATPTDWFDLGPVPFTPNSHQRPSRCPADRYTQMDASVIRSLIVLQNDKSSHHPSLSPPFTAASRTKPFSPWMSSSLHGVGAGREAGKGSLIGRAALPCLALPCQQVHTAGR